MKIRAEDLENYAGSELAKGLLPELVRRLVRASSDTIGTLYFPSGESTFTPGVDGIVRSAEATVDVPEGVSIWEVSTRRQPQGKATEDFDKRSASDAKQRYEDMPLSEITYVALTMRRWPGREGIDRDSFASDLRQQGVWKDVKVIDAIYLEEWLDRTPSVRAWLARKFDRASDDMLALEDAFDDYATGTHPEIKAELLLANRDKSRTEIVEAASAGALVRLRADSPDEAAAFVGAAIQSLADDDPKRASLLSKGVVIKHPSAKAYFTDTKNLFYVATVGQANEIAQWLANRGHTVVACYGSSHSVVAGNSPLIKLPRAGRQKFGEALVSMGMSEADANAAAIKCHSSVSVFWRQRDNAHSRTPSWASRAQLRKLVGPIFCGAFVHGSTADQEILAAIAGERFEQIEDHLGDVLRVDDAPVLREGELTALSAPADIWELCINQQVITSDMLDRFQEAALAVLGELDPALDLPPEKRAYAAIYAKRREHSESIRAGISEVLRLIAINEEGLRYITGFSAQHYINGIIGRIPALPSDYRVLASLDPLLAILAEAAPDPFLLALEELIAGDGSALSPIFEGSEDAMFGRSHYLGMLRGLEVLAWDPDRLARVSTILARLALIDPGGNLSNRPINSLIQIYLPWAPHTNASIEIRNAALTRVCETVPDIAWDLLKGLLPVDRGISFGTAKPEWREFGASERVEPTYGSVAREYEFVIGLAESYADIDAERWYAIVRSAAEGGFAQLLDRILNSIEARQEEFRAGQTSDLLWERLSALADKHYGFSDAEWAIAPDKVNRIEAVAALFKPADAMALYRPLFDHHLMERSEPGESFEERQARTEQERDRAVSQVSQDGVNAVLALAEAVKTPQLLLGPISRIASEEFARSLVLSGYNRDPAIAWLVSCVAANAVARFGFAWGSETLNVMGQMGASPEQLASILVPWNDSRQLLQYLETLPEPVQSSYWAKRDHYVRADDPAVVADFVDVMMRHGRNADLIGFLGPRNKKSHTHTLLEVLTRGFDEIVEDPEKIRRIERYWLRELFAALRDRADADRDQLMSLEYRWLPLLFSYGEPHRLALHDYLGENPEFFVQVLSDLYKSDAEVENLHSDTQPIDQDSDEELELDGQVEDPEQKRARADSANKLLESWQALPWRDGEGNIASQQAVAWAQDALRLASEAGRLRVAAREIGKLLAYAPNDEQDNLWPTREVRQIIEELANPETEDAIVLELFNKRGAHWRPQEGGGQPERELAAAANEAAVAMRAHWPRTAMMLRRSAESWLRHAEWHDRREAEDRIGL